MARAFYSLLMWLLQPWVRRRLLRRARAEPLYGEHIAERFGWYGTTTENQSFACALGRQTLVWVHAVSLGETLAAAPLIAQLRLQLPGMRLLLTHGTATGREQGVGLLQSGDVQVWQPWDTPGNVARFLDHFKPRIGLLVETEVWPNMVAACAARGLPLCLVNARMNSQSLARAQRLGWIARPAFRGLHAVWAQSQADADRLRTLGARVQGVFGNFKFDLVPDATQCAQGLAWRKTLQRPVIIFASSRGGEELLFLQALKEISALAPDKSSDYAPESIANSDLQWLIVPRHPQRFDAVASLCAAHGFQVSRRSTWGATAPVAADIWLGDSLGEMALYYGLSDVALLGGSFEPLGGHNLIEAAACACPVITGPHTFNFAQAAAMAREAGAAWEVADMAQAIRRAVALVHSGLALAQARHAALMLGAAHRGAAQRTAVAVQQVLDGGAAMQD